MPAMTPMKYMEAGLALAPSDAAGGYPAGTPVAGVAIPRSGGRFLTFILACGDITGVTALTIQVRGVNGLLSGSPSWAVLKQHDGATDLAFTAAKTIAGGQMATDGFLVGSIDTERESYEHYQLYVAAITGAAAAISAVWVKTHLRWNASSNPVLDGNYGDFGLTTAQKNAMLRSIEDDLIAKTHPA